MALKQLATKIDERVKTAIEEVCERRGLKMTRFIEEALLDKLEELEDQEEIKKLKREKFRSFSDVLADLKKHGKL